MKKIAYIPIIILFISLLNSCNNYEKLLKGTDYEAKYTAAMQYFKEERYNRARELFENLSVYYRGREHGEEIAWYYAQSLIKSEYYYNAAIQFRSFTKRYPYSPNVEEAAFLAAYCQYVESPEHTLDQTTTKDAIAEFEQFAEHYPQSVHIPEVNQYLDELRNKLMLKDFEIALSYYTTESYRAAVVALGNFLNNYPDSPYREKAMYHIIKAGYIYAIGSREDKIKERLQQVVNNFDKFAVMFKNSDYMSECQDIYTKSKARLAEL